MMIIGIGLPVHDVLGQTPIAFPGAEGFGAHALGGRGGDVYHVTNLNDSGAGSLREGVERMDGPRTIVFDVSGTIPLQARLKITHPYLTIAGQSAPGGGITLSRYPLEIAASHVVIRYIRSRVGDKVVQRTDAVHIKAGSNIIIDHVSASWAIDEVMSSQSGDVDLLTIQWSMITEALNDSHHEKGAHAYGGILGSLRQSVHHNLYAHLKSRAPKVTWRRHCKVDFRNNVVYNWMINNSYDGASSYMNWVNNYVKAGPATKNDVKYQVFELFDRYDGPLDATEDQDHETSLFAEGNFVVGAPEISADNWRGGIRFKSGANEEDHRAHEPHNFPSLPSETSAEDAYLQVLADAGASLVRDSVDTRIVAEVKSGKATYGNGVIDSQVEVGGFPELRSLPAPRDSDRDGMPDDWETAHDLDPQVASDRNANNLSGTFYTNLEVYLNGLVEEVPKYTLENTVNTFDIDKTEKTRAGYKYWFADKQLADGKTLKLSVVEPGKATHAPHQHTEDEFFFVLEGKAEFHLNGETVEVGPMTSFYCPTGSKHGIRNVGGTELKYLVIKKYNLEK